MDYYFAGKLVALRRTGYAANNGLFYVHTDHLGSVTLTTDNTRAKVAKQRFYPFGSVRNTYGTQRTDHRFTSQRLDGLKPSTGELLCYRARYWRGTKWSLPAAKRRGPPHPGFGHGR